jgi:quercetin dioxygenase-like cupin family protein
MPEAFVVTPETTPTPLNVVGEHITVLAPGSRTGSYEIFRQAGPEGSGPPPHFHPWDESFYVVKGEIAFGVDDKDMVAVPGTLVHLPAGTTHWFRFGKGGGEMISVTSREAASLFFTDVDRAISPDAPDIPKLVEVAHQHDLTVPPPPG